MNVFKTIFIVLVWICSAQFSFAQLKDESFVGHPDQLKSVQVYPNPAIEFISVKFDFPIASKTKVVVHNIIGNEITPDIEVIDEFEIKLKVKDLPDGYYFLAIQNLHTGSKTIHKFLKR